MKPVFLSWTNPHDLAAQIGAMPRSPRDYVSLFVGVSHESERDVLTAALNEQSVPFFGALFPGLVHDGIATDSGVIACTWETVAPPFQLTPSEDGFVWPSAPPSVSEFGEASVTALVLVDFWSLHITHLLDDLFDRYGDRLHVVGAGCGAGRREESECILSPAGSAAGVATVVFVRTSCRLEVQHGWRRISEPLLATRTSGNIIEEFNWEPAYDVYSRVVGEEVALSLNDTFKPEAKRYPFGIAKEGTEDIVRDPMAILANGALKCLSDVPENSVMHILHGESARLVAAAKEAATRSFAGHDVGADSGAYLVFDCFSRALLLGDEFERELIALSGSAPDGLLGVLALGEIASDGTRYPQLHNKSVVIARFTS